MKELQETGRGKKDKEWAQCGGKGTETDFSYFSFSLLYLSAEPNVKAQSNQKKHVICGKPISSHNYSTSSAV